MVAWNPNSEDGRKLDIPGQQAPFLNSFKGRNSN